MLLVFGTGEEFGELYWFCSSGPCNPSGDAFSEELGVGEQRIHRLPIRVIEIWPQLEGVLIDVSCEESEVLLDKESLEAELGPLLQVGLGVCISDILKFLD